MLKVVKELFEALKALGSMERYEVNVGQLSVRVVTVRFPMRSAGIVVSLELGIRRSEAMGVAMLVLLVANPAALTKAKELRLQVTRKGLSSYKKDGDTQ